MLLEHSSYAYISEYNNLTSLKTDLVGCDNVRNSIIVMLLYRIKEDSNL